jgi:hypothetical protein
MNIRKNLISFPGMPTGARRSCLMKNRRRKILFLSALFFLESRNARFLRSDLPGDGIFPEGGSVKGLVLCKEEYSSQETGF